MVQTVLCVVLTRQSYYRTISYYIHSTPDYDYVLWIQLHTMSRLRDGQIFTFPPSLCIFSLRLLITSPELGNWHLLGRDDSPVGELWTKYNESYLNEMEINMRAERLHSFSDQSYLTCSAGYTLYTTLFLLIFISSPLTQYFRSFLLLRLTC